MLGSLDHNVVLAAGRRLRLTGTTGVGVGGPEFVSGTSGLDIVGNSIGIRLVNAAITLAWLAIDEAASIATWANLTALRLNATNTDIQAGWLTSGIVTPGQITANVNDYNPGHAGKTAVRASSDASRNVTGLVAVSNARLLFINGGGQDIVLVHESASSAAANRFLLPGAGNLTLNTLDVVELWYDSVSARWRAIAH